MLLRKYEILMTVNTSETRVDSSPSRPTLPERTISSLQATLELYPASFKTLFSGSALRHVKEFSCDPERRRS